MSRQENPELLEKMRRAADALHGLFGSQDYILGVVAPCDEDSTHLDMITNADSPSEALGILAGMAERIIGLMPDADELVERLVNPN